MPAYIVTNEFNGASLDVDAPSIEEAATKAAATIAVGKGNLEALPIAPDWSTFALRRSGTDTDWQHFNVIRHPFN